MANWNPRFVAYANSFGRTPEDMIAIHTDADGVVSMMTFMLWIQQQWADFETQHKARRIGKTSANDVSMWRLMNMDAFDVWLAARYHR